MVGLRFYFNERHKREWMTDGTLDWLWPAAERAGVPVALAAALFLPTVGEIAERHPGLKLVFTEQTADWVPDVLVRMDDIYEKFGPNMGHWGLPLKPSEYWSRQCFVGSSLTTRRETDRKDAIGVPNIMWGTDFPHQEGTFPESTLRMHEALDGLLADLGWDTTARLDQPFPRTKTSI